MKQLPDFDLSIVMPFYKRLDEFKRVFPSKAKYYERNGIEVVIVADEPTEEQGILDYIRRYPFINWKVVVNDEAHPWRNPAKAFNVGIRQATKSYILVMDPELEFYTDVIYELREKLDSYPEHYAVGQVLFMDICEEINEETLHKHGRGLIPYGSIMAKKEYFERVGGYSEHYTEWGGEDDHLRKRLELAGIHRLFFPDSVLIHREDMGKRTVSRNEQRARIPRDVLSEMLLPMKIVVNGEDWGRDFSRITYNWWDHPYAKEQCREYLSTLKQFDISSDEIFEKSYPLIALIPTYNESERIGDCLRSVEKYCDGIILLDDDSRDDTYEIARSEKLLLKAKKVRTEFNDKQNRNILLDIASFFKAEWFIFIDADERFDDRFVDLREVMKRDDADTVGVWIANLWDSMDTYRADMEDTHPLSQNGLWFRWRMFRNKGRMQITERKRLHFKSVPYFNRRIGFADTLLLHLGYISDKYRKNKYDFYLQEDKNKLFFYYDILVESMYMNQVSDITPAFFEVKQYDIQKI